jgi:hypothetical protein
MVKLGGIPFFRGMNARARGEWVQKHAVPNEDSIGTRGERLELLQPGESDFSSRIAEEDLELLMSGNPNSQDGFWTAAEIERMVPRKPGSNAQRHTLILIRCFWAISTDYELVKSFDGPMVNVTNGSYTVPEDAQIYVLPGLAKEVQLRSKKWERKTTHKIGVAVPKERIDAEQMKEIASRSVSDPVAFELVQDGCHNFTPAAYKSLLQKIIRFRPVQVSFNGYEVSAEDAVVSVLALLAASPGSFVPDIQRFVGGLESAAKRLAVTILEDSFGEPDELLALLAAALLSQRVRDWRPSEEMLLSWFGIARRALESPVAAVVDYRGESTAKPFVFEAGAPPLHNASALLDECRSFALDLGLARGWAKNIDDLDVVFGDDRPPLMPAAPHSPP